MKFIIDQVIPLISYLQNKLGWFGEFIGIFFIEAIVVLFVFIMVGGNLDKIRNNTDNWGKRYSWRSTIIGISIFILSIPLIIIFTLYIFSFLN